MAMIPLPLTVSTLIEAGFCLFNLAIAELRDGYFDAQFEQLI